MRKNTLVGLAIFGLCLAAGISLVLLFAPRPTADVSPPARAVGVISEETSSPSAGATGSKSSAVPVLAKVPNAVPRAIRPVMTEDDILALPLIQSEISADKTCSAGSTDDPAVMRACESQASLMKRAVAAGYCLGHPGDNDNDKHWHQCGGKERAYCASLPDGVDCAYGGD